MEWNSTKINNELINSCFFRKTQKGRLMPLIFKYDKLEFGILAPHNRIQMFIWKLKYNEYNGLIN